MQYSLAHPENENFSYHYIEVNSSFSGCPFAIQAVSTSSFLSLIPAHCLSAVVCRLRSAAVHHSLANNHIDDDEERLLVLLASWPSGGL